MSTAAEKRHMGRVAALPCCVPGCGVWPVNVHHCRTGVGMGRKDSGFRTIPLCYGHHQGSVGIHGMGRKAWERMMGVTELDLLKQTNERLGISM